MKIFLEVLFSRLFPDARYQLVPHNSDRLARQRRCHIGGDPYSIVSCSIRESPTLPEVFDSLSAV